MLTLLSPCCHCAKILTVVSFLGNKIYSVFCHGCTDKSQCDHFKPRHMSRDSVSHFISLIHVVQKWIEKCDSALYPVHTDKETSDSNHFWVKNWDSQSFILWMQLEMKSSTQLGFPKSGGRPKRLRATHTLFYCSPAVKQRHQPLNFHREETGWTSWICVTGIVGQRQLKSGALKIQAKGRKGAFVSINH